MSELDGFLDAKRIDAAAQASLKARRARREPMLYQRGEWMVLEHANGRIESIAKADEFRAEMILSRMDEIKAELSLATA